jgi:hypothetical protein
MKNKDLVELFSCGAIHGKCGNMSIKGDKIYSYWAVIAVRNKDDYIISNRTSQFGNTYSRTISRHISLCMGILTPHTFADGWADSGVTAAQHFSHNTIRGLFKAFASGYCAGSACVNKKIFTIEYELLRCDGQLIAIREYVTGEELCEGCPIKFGCFTEKNTTRPFSGYIVNVLDPKYKYYLGKPHCVWKRGNKYYTENI